MTDFDRRSTLSHRVVLNQAGRAELLQLPGVGQRLAASIEDYRREHGGFRSVGELTEIHGVGPATLERRRPWVRGDSTERLVDGGLGPARLKTRCPPRKNKSTPVSNAGTRRSPRVQEASL